MSRRCTQGVTPEWGTATVRLVVEVIRMLFMRHDKDCDGARLTRESHPAPSRTGRCTGGAGRHVCRDTRAKV